MLSPGKFYDILSADTIPLHEIYSNKVRAKNCTSILQIKSISIHWRMGNDIVTSPDCPIALNSLDMLSLTLYSIALHKTFTTHLWHVVRYSVCAIMSTEYTAAGLPIPVIDGVSLLNADVEFGQVNWPLLECCLLCLFLLYSVNQRTMLWSPLTLAITLDSGNMESFLSVRWTYPVEFNCCFFPFNVTQFC